MGLFYPAPLGSAPARLCRLHFEASLLRIGVTEEGQRGLKTKLIWSTLRRPSVPDFIPLGFKASVKRKFKRLKIKNEL